MAGKKGRKDRGIVPELAKVERQLPIFEIGLSAAFVLVVALIFLAIQNPKQFEFRLPEIQFPSVPAQKPVPQAPLPGRAEPQNPGNGGNAPFVSGATQDGGGYTLVVESPSGNPIGIKSVSVDGVPSGFNVELPPGGNTSGGTVVIEIPAPVDCSLLGEQVTINITYENGETVEVPLDFSGCSNESAGDDIIEPPPVCKGAAEPCFGDGCCAGYYCNPDSGLCTTIPKGCADEGLTCGTEPCCAGLECDAITHICRVLPGCAGVNQNCTAGEDCCTLNPPLVCRDLVCRFCSSRNEMCLTDSDCCRHTPPMACSGNACVVEACVGAGSVCEGDEDCCEGACFMGVCANG